MTAKPVVFACSVCHQVITRPLTPLPPEHALCTDDGQPALPIGFFALSDDDYRTGSTGRVLVNLADLLGTSHHPDARRHSGCCGRAGGDGPNLVCAAGHEVGTERSDCWMAHAAELLPGVTPRPADESD